MSGVPLGLIVCTRLFERPLGIYASGTASVDQTCGNGVA